MPDPPVAELDEVGGGDPPADQVVGAHERIVILVAEPIDQDVGDVLVAQPAHGGILEEAARQDDAVDPPGLQAQQMGALPLRAAIGIAEQDVVAAR